MGHTSYLTVPGASEDDFSVLSVLGVSVRGFDATNPGMEDRCCTMQNGQFQDNDRKDYQQLQ